MARPDLLWPALRVILAVVLGPAVLLSGCRAGRPAPMVTAPPTTARLLLASRTPISGATPSSPTAQATLTPTSVPVTPIRDAATATPTATPTPTHVVRFVPTPTPDVVASSTPRPTTSPATVVTAATPRPKPTPERDWDPRLTQRGAQLIPAQVAPGQGYWRLVRARWFDVDEPPFAGKHFIYLDTLDQAGKRQIGVRIQMTSLDQKEDYGYVTTEAKPGEPYAANFAMYIVAPAYRVAPADGAPADAVTGLGLGSIAVPHLPMLTSYGFTWQWTVAK